MLRLLGKGMRIGWNAQRQQKLSREVPMSFQLQKSPCRNEERTVVTSSRNVDCCPILCCTFLRRAFTLQISHRPPSTYP